MRRVKSEKITQTSINQMAYEVVGGAIEVHKELGPGLLESIYEECLCTELIFRGFKVSRQVPVPIFYKGKKVKQPLFLDILVDDLIVVELKSKEELHPIDSAQILSYMKLCKKPKGLLINFNVENIANEGLEPFVNEYFADLPKR